jgi:hypothetical protein
VLVHLLANFSFVKDLFPSSPWKPSMQGGTNWKEGSLVPWIKSSGRTFYQLRMVVGGLILTSE